MLFSSWILKLHTLKRCQCCCWHFRLRIGSFIVGALLLVYSSLAFIWWLVSIRWWHALLLPFIDERVETGNYFKFLKLAYFVVLALSPAFEVILIVGTYQRDLFLLYLWLCFTFYLRLLWNSIIGLIMLVCLIIYGYWKIAMAGLVVFVVITVVFVYSYMVVCSYHRSLCDRSQLLTPVSTSEQQPSNMDGCSSEQGSTLGKKTEENENTDSPA